MCRQRLNFKFSNHLSTDAVRVPVVSVVLEGGPNTLETVRSAVDKGTPAVIIKVSKLFFCDYVYYSVYLRDVD